MLRARRRFLLLFVMAFAWCVEWRGHHRLFVGLFVGSFVALPDGGLVPAWCFALSLFSLRVLRGVGAQRFLELFVVVLCRGGRAHALVRRGAYSRGNAW